MKKILIFLLTCMFLVSMFTVINADRHVNKNENIENFSPNEVIVKFKRGLSENNVNYIASANGLSVISKSQYSGVHKLKIPNGITVIEITERLNKNPNIEYAEPNYIAYACMTPNDPEYNLQWHLHDLSQGGINMEPAWDITSGSGAIVAIVDTGISIGSDLSDTCFVSGKDFVNNDNDPTDDNGHGTHVAGTVAQSTNNNIGVCGVAYNACLMPIKVLNSYGSGSVYDIADGIIWATNNLANIISMSLGGSYPSTTLENAVAYAYNNNVTCIAASGNNGQNGILYPAAYDDYVIAVGATRYDKTRSYYSNYGNSLDVVAPGGDIYVDQNNDGHEDGVYQETFDPNWGYYFWQGTSMATPHVSGTAALLYSQGITSPDDIRNTLQSSAVDLGAPDWDMYYGHGLINAYNALTYNGNNPPTCTLTANPSSGEAPFTTTFSMSASDSDGTIASWELDVDNNGIADYSGSGSPLPTQTHTYNNAGEYTAKLTVWDNLSATGMDTTTVTVTVPNNPPAAPSNLMVQHYGTVSIQDTAVSFSITYAGSTSNDYTATHTSDDLSHGISEDNRVEGGSGKATLDIIYNIPISSGTIAPYKIYIESHKIDSDDTYSVSYTINGVGGESNIITITASSDDIFNYQLSGVSAGDTVNINIKDSSMKPRENVGTIYIDHLYIGSGGSGDSNTDDNKLTWDRSLDDGLGADDVTHYNIYRSISSSGPWNNIIDSVIADNSASYVYIDSGAGTADSTIWWYIVRAVDSGGLNDGNTNSVQEPTGDTTPPGKVTGLTATAVGSSQIDLTWTANTDSDLDYYKIYRDSSYIDSTTLASYSDTGLSPDTTYTYEVSAVDISGNEGIRSDPVSATTESGSVVVTVTSTTPNNMQRGTTISVTISGSGFQPGAEVTFENGAGPNPITSSISVDNSNTITCNVYVKSGGPPRDRLWDVRVTNSDSSTGVLVDGFTVNP